MVVTIKTVYEDYMGGPMVTMSWGERKDCTGGGKFAAVHVLQKVDSEFVWRFGCRLYEPILVYVYTICESNRPTNEDAKLCYGWLWRLL